MAIVGNVGVVLVVGCSELEGCGRVDSCNPQGTLHDEAVAFIANFIVR
jgi:hypothetical protein